MKYNRSHFLTKLIEHEGMVLNVYKDTLGIDTIGIGRNLKDRGISKEELEYMVSEKSRMLDDLLALGIFTEGQIQRGKSKLRKACLAQIKNNEIREEE